MHHVGLHVCASGFLVRYKHRWHWGAPLVHNHWLTGTLTGLWQETYKYWPCLACLPVSSPLDLHPSTLKRYSKAVEHVSCTWLTTLIPSWNRNGNSGGLVEQHRTRMSRNHDSVMNSKYNTQVYVLLSHVPMLYCHTYGQSMTAKVLFHTYPCSRYCCKMQLIKWS